MTLRLICDSGRRVPAYRFDCGKIISAEGVIVPTADALDLIRILAGEALSLAAWRRKEAAEQFAQAALDLHAAWEAYEADRAGMSCARAMLRRLERPS